MNTSCRALSPALPRRSITLFNNSVKGLLARSNRSAGAGAVKIAKLRPRSESEKKNPPRGRRALSLLGKTATETNQMKTADSTLHQVRDLVQAEIDKHLTEDFVIDQVTSQFLENIEGEW